MKEMIKARKEQLRKRGQKGFTLMEMLIVVAIIAVLIAIAIPVFMAQMNTARAETDTANIRSGYAAAVSAGMTNGINTGTTTYYLQKDGTVSETSSNDYTCQGSGTNATGDIAGFTSASSINWAAGNTITYTWNNADNKITAITAVS